METKVISVRVSKKLKKALHLQATNEHRTLSNYIEHELSKLMKEKSGENK